MFQNLQILKEERNGMLVTTNVSKTLRFGIWGHGEQVGVLAKSIGNLRTTTTAWSTTTGSELHCTAQARPVNFAVVVSSTTPNKVESRRPSAGINPLF